MKPFIVALFILFTTGTTMAQPPKTLGVHHVGLTVKDLATTTHFFTEALGFNIVKQRPDYPATFVSDGTNMITLWQVQDSTTATPFDRKNNIGLHHMAFELGSLAELEAMHARIKNWPGVEIEFAPELVGDGPAQHTIFREPGGIRLEFIVVP